MGAALPRKRAAPRLYLDRKRGSWIIRDGPAFVRTGCIESDREGAEKRLAAYLGTKYQPQRGPAPLIADVLTVYGREHLPHTRTAAKAAYHLTYLSAWWGEKNLSAVTAKNCRAYAEGRPSAMARRDLETLRAAIGYWHREYGPLPSIPIIVLPPKPSPREHWLTRNQAATLLRAAKHIEHLKRFIILGLHTGSRSGAILSLQWDRIDFAAGVMRRRGFGELESKTKRTPPVRLGRRTLAFLRRWRAMDNEHSQFVVHWGGKRIKTIEGAFTRAATSAAVHATPHTLRHTRATWLMQAGVDPWEAAGHLGMTLAVLVGNYGKHSPDFQKRAAEV